MLDRLVSDPDIAKVELILDHAGFLCRAETARMSFQSAAGPTLDAAVRAVVAGRQKAEL